MRAWPLLMVLFAGCSRTALDTAELVAVITPREQTVRVGEVASWEGSTSDTEDEPTLFAWRIFARPKDATAPLINSGTSAQLRPDQPGEWVIELQVADENRRSEPEWALLRVRGADVVRDAGVPDAGSPDAGIPDAGVRDAGFNGETFDPLGIYLDGTLQQGACYRDAIAPLLAPNIASVGFQCGAEPNISAMVRPGDGRLLYYQAGVNLLRVYRCDFCSVTSPEPYPGDPLANDGVVSTPCPGISWLFGFLISVEGELLYRCNASATEWRGSDGNTVAVATLNEPLVALGAWGWAISEKRVFNWKTGIERPIVGLPAYSNLIASRWAPPDGFHFAIEPFFGGEELWRVSTTGVAQKVGAYGALPPGASRTLGAKLDREGRLFHVVLSNATTADLVVRREVGAPTQIVYTEESDPLVKLHGSRLITGP